MNKRRYLLASLLFALPMVVAAPHKCLADPYDTFAANGDYVGAATTLLSMPKNSAQTGTDINKILVALPQLNWTNDSLSAWTSTMTAIEEETNSYWAINNAGAIIAASDSANVPQNNEIASIVDRAVSVAEKWPDQGGTLLAAKALVWRGDFKKALSLYSTQQIPEPLVEFEFETLADKPELTSNPDLWQIALQNIGTDATAKIKAIRALAFVGKSSEAIVLARTITEPCARMEETISVARYARFGGNMDEFISSMEAAESLLQSLPEDPQSLIVYRDFLAETTVQPIAYLPKTFWMSAENWARSQTQSLRDPALSEVAASSAWAGRDDASTLIPLIQNSYWADDAKTRVACGLLWSGKPMASKEIIAQIHDPDWLELANEETAYLARQQTGLSSIQNRTSQ